MAFLYTFGLLLVSVVGIIVVLLITTLYPFRMVAIVMKETCLGVRELFVSDIAPTQCLKTHRDNTKHSF